MKIGILLTNAGIEERNLSKPYLGNPGIGGAEYSRILLGYYLAKYDVGRVTFYAMREQIMPKRTECKVVIDYEEAINRATSDGMDWFIMNSLPSAKVAAKAFAAIRESNLNIVYIGDNFFEEYEVKQIIKTPNIRKVVCVGDEQYNHIDKAIKKRAVCLYHMHAMSAYPISYISKDNPKKPIVMYQGAIIPPKGFHELARIWKWVHFLVPKAELEVLGSGQLYRNAYMLGKYGIAEENYEKQFMKYLVNKDGDIRKEVHFHGLCGGSKKIELMKRAKVGVLNPTGETETWGLSASEFEAMCIPVVTCNKNGCKDSVKNFAGGFRFNSRFGFAIYLVLLLRFDWLNRTVGIAGRKRIGQISNVKKIVNEWQELLRKVNDKVEKDD